MSDLTGEVFLAIVKRGSRLVVVRHTAKMGRLGPDERGVRLRLSMPSDLFRLPPVPTVEVHLDPEFVAVSSASVEVLQPIEVVEIARAMQADIDQIMDGSR